MKGSRKYQIPDFIEHLFFLILFDICLVND